jgi:hypothetical protein
MAYFHEILTDYLPSTLLDFRYAEVRNGSKRRLLEPNRTYGEVHTVTQTKGYNFLTAERMYATILSLIMLLISADHEEPCQVALAAETYIFS